jgi:threonine/homoserine/homoserine lactone efflux protein
LLILISIALGLALSLVFIGPLFFLTIETGLTRGRREGISLILGATMADFLFVITAIAYSDITMRILNQYPLIRILGGMVIVLFGAFLSRKDKKIIQLETGEKHRKYPQLFLKGFTINIVNVGIFFFWLFIINWVRNRFPGQTELVWFVAVTLGTYALVETGKLFYARHIKTRLTDRNLYLLHQVVRAAIVTFGVVIIFS